ncbi:hypothetical protein GWK47_047099 [Chionoecetes opilio]|uniref:Uncharacterized protein n=1 Tax=Chionoecetes opilio TaxID=41210 RepID=A0A8J5CT74_CHIOP|nr:hypothetical protein GWK47_047099 [Chionoecetes opilio]
MILGAKPASHISLALPCLVSLPTTMGAEMRLVHVWRKVPVASTIDESSVWDRASHESDNLALWLPSEHTSFGRYKPWVIEEKIRVKYWRVSKNDDFGELFRVDRNDKDDVLETSSGKHVYCFLGAHCDVWVVLAFLKERIKTLESPAKLDCSHEFILVGEP